MSQHNLACTSYIFVFMFLISSAISYQCIKNSPCSCVYEDGREISLHKLPQQTLQATIINITYIFHPCSNIAPNLPKVPENETIQNECKNTTLCLFNRTDYTAKSIGNTEVVKFSADSNSEKYSIIYPLGNSTTFIKLACSDVFESVLYIKSSDINNHNFVLFSENSCTFMENTGLGTGSVLVILLLVLTSAYLLCGGAVLYFIRGARGREIIPNIDFWTDFPILVKDGAVFLQNGCKPVISNSESYDRI